MNLEVLLDDHFDVGKLEVFLGAVKGLPLLAEFKKSDFDIKTLNAYNNSLITPKDCLSAYCQVYPVIMPTFERLILSARSYDCSLIPIGSTKGSSLIDLDYITKSNTEMIININQALRVLNANAGLVIGYAHKDVLRKINNYDIHLN